MSAKTGDKGPVAIRIGNNIQAVCGTDALIKLAYSVMRNGQTVAVKGQKLVELSPTILSIGKPLNCLPLLSERKNNPFSSIAETIWVLSGRTDTKWLSYYVPQAVEWSDDGVNWRAGYGGRIRNLHHTTRVDQIKHVFDVLSKDISSRQAVIGIYNTEDDSPAVAWSKDIPCTLSIQFLVRNGIMETFCCMRSNDVMWGFSGINIIEWALLSSMLSTNLGVKQGRYFHFTGSMHIYEHHWEMASAISSKYVEETEHDGYVIIDESARITGYMPAFDLPITEMDIVLTEFMTILEDYKTNENGTDALDRTERLVKGMRYGQYFKFLLAYTAFKQDDINSFQSIWSRMSDSELVLAGEFYLMRNAKGAIKDAIRDLIKPHHIEVFKAKKLLKTTTDGFVSTEIWG